MANAKVVVTGLCMAIDLGASSPNTICNIVMVPNATGSAI